MKTSTASRLSVPPADPNFGFFVLTDGSRIYPSGRDDQRGRYFVWRCTGMTDIEEWDHSGKYRCVRHVREGTILMNRQGIRYFDDVEAAIAAVVTTLIKESK